MPTYLINRKHSAKRSQTFPTEWCPYSFVGLASYQPSILFRNLKSVTLTSFCMFDFKDLYAEEGRCLFERKTSLNRLEGFQDYIVAFIDKILNTEGHCLLVHTKRVSLSVSCLFLKYCKISKTLY